MNTTGTALLGLTVGCAQCHDHKFDPISQREYFQLYAFFNNQDEPTLPIPTPEQQAALDTHAARLRQLEADLAALRTSDRSPEPESTDTTPAELTRIEAQLKKPQKSKPSTDTTLVLTELRELRPSYVRGAASSKLREAPAVLILRERPWREEG